MSKKVIIIGSGIAGISSSLKLKSYGINSIILDKGDFIVVAQLVGGRLPEGSTTLPTGFSFKYLLVKIL